MPKKGILVHEVTIALWVGACALPGLLVAGLYWPTDRTRVRRPTVGWLIAAYLLAALYLVGIVQFCEWSQSLVNENSSRAYGNVQLFGLAWGGHLAAVLFALTTVRLLWRPRVLAGWCLSAIAALTLVWLAMLLLPNMGGTPQWNYTAFLAAGIAGPALALSFVRRWRRRAGEPEEQTHETITPEQTPAVPGLLGRRLARIYGGLIGGMCVGVPLGCFVVRFAPKSCLLAWVLLFSTVIALTALGGYTCGKLVGRVRRVRRAFLLTLPFFAYAIMGVAVALQGTEPPTPMFSLTDWCITPDARVLSVGWETRSSRGRPDLDGRFRHCSTEICTVYIGVGLFKKSDEMRWFVGLPLPGDTVLGIVQTSQRSVISAW